MPVLNSFLRHNHIVTSGIVPDWKYEVIEINDELKTFKGKAVNPTGNQPRELEMSLWQANLLVENKFKDRDRDTQIEIDSDREENESNSRTPLTPEERSKQLTREVEEKFAQDAYLIDETDVPTGAELRKVKNAKDVRFDVWVWAFVDDQGTPLPKQKRIGQIVQSSDIHISAYDLHGSTPGWFKRTTDSVNFLIKRADLQPAYIQEAFSLWQQQQVSDRQSAIALSSPTEQQPPQKSLNTEVVVDETDVPDGVTLRRTDDWISVEYEVWAWVIANVKGVPTRQQKCIGRIVQTSLISTYSPTGRHCGSFRQTLNAVRQLIEVAGYRPEEIKEAFAAWQENEAPKDLDHLIEDHGDFIDDAEEDLRLASDYEAEQQPEEDSQLSEEDLKSIQSWITLDDLDQMK